MTSMRFKRLRLSYSDAVCMLTQVTRDKLLREHLYSETVDFGKGTGSGYPGGVQWQHF